MQNSEKLNFKLAQCIFFFYKWSVVSVTVGESSKYLSERGREWVEIKLQ